MKRRILIIHNPIAGRPLITRWRESKMLKLLHLLTERGHEVSMILTERAGHAEKLAYEAEDIDVIVAAGGDGTINEIVNGLCQRDEAKLGPSIAVLPMGTANVLAWELGLPSDLKKIINIIEAGRSKKVYPGLADDRRFLLMASSGLDSRVVNVVNSGLKRFIGGAAYVVAAFTVLKQKPPFIRVRVNGQRLVANTVIVTRAARYGGPFVVAPDADISSDDLYVILLPLYGYCAALCYGVNLALGRLHLSRDVTVLKTNEVQFETAKESDIQMDGDGPFIMPMNVTVDQRSVGILVSS
ncbi:diacylglycerol/lipid kinase family protein [Curvivirga sp.]|uniref:diacylglycerol/lipid kinase family protein n=1 Tax=Curvivirga sp. TaxID=2856848 RepID=UPI003B5975E8